MAKGRAASSQNPPKKIRPALTPEARENQMISLAMDLVEQRLLDGTASSQETTHFLKLGSTKARAELEKLRKENELLVAKKKDLESKEQSGTMYEEALKAMRLYSGQVYYDEED